MALFDQGSFNPQTYQGLLEGLLGRLNFPQPQESQGFAPSPQTGPTFAGPANGMGSMGGVPYPVIGAPQDNATLPPNAQPTQAQAPQMQQPTSFLDNLSAGASNFTTGGNPIAGLINSIKGFTTGERTDALGMKTANQNLIAKALVGRGLDEGTAKAAAMNPQLMSALAPVLFGTKDQTSDIKEYQFAQKQGFKGSFSDWIANKRAGAGEYGLQPIWGTGPDGKPTIVQLGKGGTAIQSVLPEGVQVGKDAIRVDAGTHTVLLDPVTRQQIGIIPKNIEQKESAEKRGAAQGAAQVDLPRIRDNATFMIKTIDDVLNDPYREIGTGMSAISTMIPGTGAYDFGQKVDQLKGKAFLEAFNSLKGGGQITEIEGKKATDAIARLSTFQTEAGFKKALEDLKEVVNAGLDRTKKLAGQGGAPSPAPAVPDLKKKYGRD